MEIFITLSGSAVRLSRKAITLRRAR